MVLTNAAGGLRSDFQVGQAVLISDHLNLTATSPIVDIKFDSGTLFVQTGIATTHAIDGETGRCTLTSGGPGVDARGRVRTTVFARRPAERGGYGIPSELVRETLGGVHPLRLRPTACGKTACIRRGFEMNTDDSLSKMYLPSGFG